MHLLKSSHGFEDLSLLTDGPESLGEFNAVVLNGVEYNLPGTNTLVSEKENDHFKDMVERLLSFNRLFLLLKTLTEGNGTECKGREEAFEEHSSRHPSVQGLELVPMTTESDE